MKVELIRIGNSRGVRIPKALIEQYGFGEGVELRIEKDRLVMVPDHRPRQGWEEAFRRAGESAKDEVLLGSIPRNEFDDKEWRW
jgi:antitoxin MazE